MIKFFVDSENIFEDKIYLDSREDLKHLVKVLRSKVGDRVLISDKVRWEYTAEIAEIRDTEAVLRILERHAFEREPETKVTLYQGVPKGQKMETIIQKTVELGVERIVPVFMSRTVVEDKGNYPKKIARYQKIADEAVKQCKRDIIPEVSGSMNFREMAEELRKERYGLVLVPYENEEGKTIKNALREDTVKKGSRLAIVIGPEGGFEEEEIRILAEDPDIEARVVSLGKIIMRTETAGMAALAMTMFELEL